MLQTFLDGGIMMYPLGLCSVLSLAIIIERIYSLRRKKVIKPETNSMVDNIGNKEDVKKVLSFVKENSDIFSNLVREALKVEEFKPDDVNKAIEDQGRQEVRRLEKGLSMLETIAAITPLLGLLGTVIGMIEVFDVITIEGQARTASLSSGISQALITTVAGLSVGILSLIFYNFFTNKAEDLVLEIEKYTATLINKIKKF